FGNAPDFGKVSHLCVGQFGARDTRGSSLYEELFGDPCCRRSQSKTHQSRYYCRYGTRIYHRGRSAALHRHNPPLAGGSRLHDVFIYLSFRWYAPGGGTQKYPAFCGAGYACGRTALNGLKRRQSSVSRIQKGPLERERGPFGLHRLKFQRGSEIFATADCCNGRGLAREIIRIWLIFPLPMLLPSASYLLSSLSKSLSLETARVFWSSKAIPSIFSGMPLIELRSSTSVFGKTRTSAVDGSASASRLGAVFASFHLLPRILVAWLRSTLYSFATRSVRSRTRSVVGFRAITPESFISSGVFFGLGSNSFDTSNR